MEHKWCMERKPLRMIDDVRVQKQCHADWDAMTGDDAKRFCSQCQKHVHNLSALSREDAERLIATSPKLCVRYQPDAQGAPITKPSWRQPGRAVLALAAAVMSSLLTACNVAQSQPIMGDMPVPEPPPVDATHPDNSGKGTRAEAQMIMGKIATPQMMGEMVVETPKPSDGATGTVRAASRVQKRVKR